MCVGWLMQRESERLLLQAMMCDHSNIVLYGSPQIGRVERSHEQIYKLSL